MKPTPGARTVRGPAALLRSLRLWPLGELAPVAGLFAVVAIVTLPQQLVQDSWLMLVDGREVSRTGLPAHDHLAIWTSGVRWIDQQWLGQLFFFRIADLGGIEAALLVNVVLLLGAFALALTAARRLGGSTFSITVVGLVVMFAAPWELQMRTQSLAELFFVALLWLLAAARRSSSRRVWLFVPLLCLWANVHGSVVLGAALVSLWGLCEAGRLRRRDGGVAGSALLRVAGLVVVPWLCMLASPYGLGLVGYYRSTLLDSRLRDFVLEWQPSTPAVKTAVFFAAAFAAVAVLARWGSRLAAFETLTVLFTLVLALSALRNIIWFALACLILLPQAVDAGFAGEGERWQRSRRLVEQLLARRAVGAVAFTAVAAVALFAVSQPASWFTGRWPDAPAATRIAESSQPTPRVFADDRYADWLLWYEPGLRGKVAYDLRLELLTDGQLTDLQDYRDRSGPAWANAASGYRTLVFDPRTEAPGLAAARRQGSTHVVYEGETLAALSVGPGPARRLTALP